MEAVRRARVGRVRARLPRSRPAGVRVRSALSAATVVAAAVGLAALGLVWTARSTLTANVDAAATQRGGQVVAAIRGGDPVRLDQTLRASAGDQTLVQIVNPPGQVVAASTAIKGLPAITTARPAPGTSEWSEHPLPLSTEDTYRVLTTTVSTDDGVRVVIVAQSLRPVNESIEAIARSAIVALPLLAAVAALATYVFVGRSLRPVEAIRHSVAAITSRDLSARVPVPPADDEIAALAQTMNGMLDRLQHSADVQRRFIADASHELRGPLTTLQVGLDVLTASTGPAATTDRLRAEVTRLSALVADLLLLARIDEQALRLRDEDIDLDDIVYRHRDRLRDEHPDLTVTAHVEPVRVRGDGGHLDRVVRNLCDNAARHARAAVRLTLRATAGQAELTVADDGGGIAAADRDRVFDRFVRLDDSRTRTDGGTGLGLAIARDIARAHHGSLTIDRDSLGGALLIVRIPLPPTTSEPPR